MRRIFGGMAGFVVGGVFPVVVPPVVGLLVPAADEFLSQWFPNSFLGFIGLILICAVLGTVLGIVLPNFTERLFVFGQAAFFLGIAAVLIVATASRGNLGVSGFILLGASLIFGLWGLRTALLGSAQDVEDW